MQNKEIKTPEKEMTEAEAKSYIESIRSKNNEEDFKAMIKMIDEGSITFDFNGHFQCETDKRLFHIINLKKNQAELFEHIALWTLGSDLWFPEELDKVYDCMRKGIVAEKPVRFHVDQYGQCSVCGERLKFEFDGKEIRIRNKCESPEGYFPMKNTMDFPSGKVVACNDMRVLWPDVEAEIDTDRYGKYSLNTSIGVFNTVNVYMKHNMSHVFVGNTSPVVHVDNGNIIVGNPGYAEDEENNILLPGKKVADICSDLWWCCMTDYEEAERRFNKYKDDITARWDGKTKISSFEEFLKDRSCDVFEVDSGTYEFEVYEHPNDMVSYQNELEYDGQPVIYSIAKKV